MHVQGLLLGDALFQYFGEFGHVFGLLHHFVEGGAGRVVELLLSPFDSVGFSDCAMVFGFASGLGKLVHLSKGGLFGTHFSMGSKLKI